jgi:glycerophosphoryl diester phosphodiesterase
MSSPDGASAEKRASAGADAASAEKRASAGADAASAEKRASAGPLVFAHRGASAERPEHTAEAYRLAIEQGADGLECDVRLTSDGHLVCIHDATLRRTSNGRGRVSAMTLDEMRQLDFGGSRVLTLDELLALATAAARPLRLLVETKHPSRFGAGVEERLVELLHRHDLAGSTRPRSPSVRVIVMSFSPLAVRTMRGLAPELESVFLYEVASPRVRDGRPPFGAGVLGPGIGALRAHPEVVDRAHGRGHRVYVWTVNTADEIALAAGLGVDGIISDRPAFVLSELGRGPAPVRG